MNPIARKTRQSGTTLCATDRQGSLLAQVQAGQSDSFAYSPYGHRPAAQGIGFNGELADPLTGHYLLGNGHRAYNPVLMRFNRPDSLSPFGKGGLNAYAYCTGDPVNHTDPTGQAADDQVRSFMWVALGLLGAAWGVKLAVPSITKVLSGGAPLFVKLAAGGAVGQFLASSTFTVSRVIAASNPESKVADPLMWGAIALAIPSLGARVSSFFIGQRAARMQAVVQAQTQARIRQRATDWQANLAKRVERQNEQLPFDTRLPLATGSWRRAVDNQQDVRRIRSHPPLQTQ